MLSLPHHRKALALAIGYCLLLYWPAVSGRGFFYERDIWLYWIPHIEWATRTLASGHLPEWNPFKGFGSPFMADPNFQFFYPPSILNWILPARTAYTILVAGHSIFGVLGAYRLLAPRLRSRLSALVGALIFVAAGPVVSSANLWHHFSSVMYMPWVLDAFLRLRAGRGSTLRLGLLTGLQALAGSADVCVMTGLGLALLLPTRPRRLGRLIPKLGAALALCCGLAAVQWLPTALLASKAARSNLDDGTRLHWSVLPVTLIDFVIPLSGVAHAAPERADFFEQRFRIVPWMYLGASTLPLLLLGIRRAPRGGLVLLFSILLCLGRHTPLAGWMSHLPVISMLRFPSKLLWLVAAVWAMLSAIGHKELGRTGRVTTPYLIPTGVMLLLGSVCLLAYGPVSPSDSPDWLTVWRGVPWAPLGLGSILIGSALGRRALSATALVVAIDLLVPAQAYNAYSSGEMFQVRPSLVDELVRDKAERIHVFQRSRTENLTWKVPEGWSEEEAYYFGQSQFLQPPQSMRWSIKGSFDGDFNGLAPLEYSALTSVALEGLTLKPHLLRLAGVTHAIRFPGPQPPELPLVKSIPTLHALPVLLLKVPSPLPMAYVVHRIREESSSHAAIRALSDPGFDSAHEIIRVGEPDTPEWRAAEAPEAPPEARVEAEEPGRWVIRARLSSPGALVVLSALSDGWRARVDGKPQPVLPANLLFLSVDLGAGEHEVEFEYQTPGLWFGLCLSAFAWTGLGVASARHRPVARKDLDSAG
ncbi:MAG: YfhO family protein [Vicinamibacteria bacterium]